MVNNKLMQLRKAGVHFGHKANCLNPKMIPYIFAEKNGRHILDLIQTSFLLNQACIFVKMAAQQKKNILFIGTSSKISKIVAQEGTLQDVLIDQITGVLHQTTLNNYSALSVALSSGSVDGFVAELPVAQGLAASNSNFAIVRFADGLGFTVSDEDVIVSVALRQEDVNLLAAVNAALATITTAQRNEFMQAALLRQPQE